MNIHEFYAKPIVPFLIDIVQYPYIKLSQSILLAQSNT